jgi:hypothetical protein
MAGSCVALDTYYDLALRINAGTKGYRDFVRSALVKEGYEIIEPDDLDGDRKKELKDEIKKNKEELNLEDSQLKAEANLKVAEGIIEKVSINELELNVVNKEGVKKLKEAKKIDKYQEAKLNLIVKYNTPIGKINLDLVEADKDGMYLELKLRYWFNEGREYLEDRDWRVADKALKHGRAFKPDLNKDTISPKIKHLEKIGIKFLFEKKLIHNEDPELRKFVSDLKETNLIELKALTGLNVGNLETPVEVVRKIFKIFGYRLNPVKRMGHKDMFGKRHIIYEIVDKYENYAKETIERWTALDKKNSLEKKVSRICLQQGKRIENITDEEIAVMQLSDKAQIEEFLAYMQNYAVA